jgi:hypothetical protein
LGAGLIGAGLAASYYYPYYSDPYYAYPYYDDRYGGAYYPAEYAENCVYERRRIRTAAGYRRVTARVCY